MLWISVGSLLISLILCGIIFAAIILFKRSIDKAVELASNVNNTLTNEKDENSIAFQIKKGSDRYHCHEERLKKVEAQLGTIDFIKDYDQKDICEIIELLKALARVKGRLE